MVASESESVRFFVGYTLDTFMHSSEACEPTDRDQKHIFERVKHIVAVIGNTIHCLCRQFDQ